MKRKIIASILLLILNISIFAEEYGVVLSGGGGKGAYEIGAWKALKEYGIVQKTTAISGTSVGGLNAALFSCITDINEIERIWVTMVPTRLTQDDALISQEGLGTIIDKIPLYRLQSNPFPQAYITTVRNKNLISKALTQKGPGSYASRFNLNSEKTTAEIKQKLLATSAFPVVCKPIRLNDGYDYVDGGFEQAGGDNVPLDPLVTTRPKNTNIKKIIIIYLSNTPTRIFRDIDYDEYELIRIVPSIDLGNILDGTTNFTSNRIQLLIKTGYTDTVKVLQKLGYKPVLSYWFE